MYPIVFYNPTEECLNWMVKYINKRKVIDCGSGVGRLSSKLMKRCVSVTPVDFFLKDCLEAYPVQIDAVDFPYPENPLVIIARPCRGDWIHQVIKKVVENNGEVLYVGLQKHYEEDLEPLESRYLLEKLYDNAGDDGEYIYSIKSKKSCKEQVERVFCLVYDEGAGSSWWESDGDQWRNSAGGWMPKRDNDVVLEECEAKDFGSLDWTKTYLLKPDSNMGWLSRAGRFYGCSYMDHDLLAYYVLRKDVSELEDTGWVRVLHDGFECQERLSPEQRNFLQTRGHIVGEDD